MNQRFGINKKDLNENDCKVASYNWLAKQLHCCNLVERLATNIGDNSTAIRSPFTTIQTILFRDSSREVGLHPQILVSATGQIINHYQNFFYSNRIKHAKRKHIISNHTYTVTLAIYVLYQQYGSIAQQNETLYE